MSYTTIKALWPTGRKKRVEDLQELPNSHGSAPPVWEVMACRYLGTTAAYGPYPKKGWMELGDELWDLWKRTDIPKAYRAVFMLTFDRAYVVSKDYQRMHDDILAFMQEFPPKLGHENHWRAIARALLAHPEIPAIGLHCTSVSEDPFQGPWNEKKERHDPFDWKTAFNIYENLDAL